MNEPLRQRQPREKCPAFLAFVRRHACLGCSRKVRVEAAHLRMTDPRHPEKRRSGIGEKPDDRWANPLCDQCHRTAADSQHNLGEEEFWRRLGVDPFENAKRLWDLFQRSRS